MRTLRLQSIDFISTNDLAEAHNWLRDQRGESDEGQDDGPSRRSSRKMAALEQENRACQRCGSGNGWKRHTRARAQFAVHHPAHPQTCPTSDEETAQRRARELEVHEVTDAEMLEFLMDEELADDEYGCSPDLYPEFYIDAMDMGYVLGEIEVPLTDEEYRRLLEERYSS